MPAFRAGWPAANIKYAYPEGVAAGVVTDVGQALARAHLLWMITSSDDVLLMFPPLASSGISAINTGPNCNLEL
jgi:hypothetical protein